MKKLHGRFWSRSARAKVGVVAIAVAFETVDSVVSDAVRARNHFTSLDEGKLTGGGRCGGRDDGWGWGWGWGWGRVRGHVVVAAGGVNGCGGLIVDDHIVGRT